MTRWQKIALAAFICVLGLTITLSLGYRAKTAASHFFYPVAPPMPAIVSESMPEVLAHLEAVLKTNAPSVFARLQPGLTADAIAKLEQKYSVQLPDDIKAIYEWHDGCANTSSNRLSEDFIPMHRFPSLEETLSERAMEGTGDTVVQRAVYHALVEYRASWIHLFDDGAGDGYWFDPKRKPSEGALFYNFTEVGEFVFFPSAKNLMAGIARCYETGAFRFKPDTNPPDLDEDFVMAKKIWEQFGANNPL